MNGFVCLCLVRENGDDKRAHDVPPLTVGALQRAFRDPAVARPTARLLAVRHRSWRRSVRPELKCRELQISHVERVDRAIPVDLWRVEWASALDPILVGEDRDLVLVRTRHWVISLSP